MNAGNLTAFLIWLSFLVWIHYELFKARRSRKSSSSICSGVSLYRKYRVIKRLLGGGK